MPGWTTTPHHTTTATATGSTSTITFTVTSTTANDFGIVAIGILASAFGTWTVPSGWTLVDQFNVSGIVTAIFLANKLQPGVTSLAFTTTNVTTDACGIYACWSQATLGLDGPASANGTTTPLPTVSTANMAKNGALGIWVGTVANTTAPGNPTGTGTWTSVNTVDAATVIGMRMSCQLGVAAGSKYTASGSTGPAIGNDTVFITGLDPTVGFPIDAPASITHP